MSMKRIYGITLICPVLIIMVMLSACQPATTPAPTPGQQAAPTGTAEDFHFAGVIESISADKWVIGGETFKVDQNTEFDSGLAVGVRARVEYIILSDGTKLAREIETP